MVSAGSSHLLHYLLLTDHDLDAIWQEKGRKTKFKIPREASEGSGRFLLLAGLIEEPYTEVASIVGKTMGRMKLLRDEKMNKYLKK